MQAAEEETPFDGRLESLSGLEAVLGKIKLAILLSHQTKPTRLNTVLQFVSFLSIYLPVAIHPSPARGNPAHRLPAAVSFCASAP